MADRFYRRGQWRIPSRGFRGDIVLTTTFSIVLVGSLCAMPSVEGHPLGSSSVSGRVYAAPFVHTIPEISKSVALNFCNATGGFSTAPGANPKTGAVAVGINSQTTACPNQADQTFFSASMGFGGPSFTARSNSSMNVTFRWIVSWAANWSARVPSGAPTYNSDAYFQVYTQDSVYDLLTSTTAGYGSVMIWERFATNVTAHFSARGILVNDTINLRVVSGRTYEFLPNLVVFVSTFAEPGSQSSATLNVATNGDGGRLASIVLT